VAIAVVFAFVLGRAVVGSIAWACSCGPTGLDHEGRYEFWGGIVYVGEPEVRTSDRGWPQLLFGRLPVDTDETGEFVLADPDGQPALTIVVDAS
jgi:hypothetical protein